MAQTINTNVASLNAQRNLNSSQSSLATSLERLSTGLRINSAKDDSAGLAISERMTSQINGLNQATRNANDGISLSQTAEGALSSVGDSLQRIRELAVQSANATNSSSDRAAIQSEVSQLVSEISRVGSQTQFNGLNLLDGSFTSKSFQVGANAGQTIDIASIADARASSLGQHSLAADGSITGNVVTGASGAVANGVTAATSATGFTIATDAGTSSAISYAANAGADAIAAAINSGAGTLGVTATATNSATLSTLSSAGTVSFSLNGSAVSATIADQNDLSNLVSAINGVSGASGITAEFTSTSSKSSITLTTTDGRNINLQDFASDGGATESIKLDATTLTEGTAVSGVKTGTVALSSSKGAISTAAASAEVFASAGVNNSTFSSVAALDLSTEAGATSALTIVDAALAQINSSRGDLGAIQNRFSTTISSLQTSSENLSASRSRIQDADFASETANLSRAQILQQAGTAMLAQANALPQSVLSLLQ